jgi:hypothetical protein
MSEETLVTVCLADVPLNFPTPRGPAIPPTLDELVGLEPRIAELLAEAEHARETAGPTFCANAVFYGYAGHDPGLKCRLSKLVGWTSGQKGLLRTSAAYDVVYKEVWGMLPPCGPDCYCRRINRQIDEALSE